MASFLSDTAMHLQFEKCLETVKIYGIFLMDYSCFVG